MSLLFLCMCMYEYVFVCVCVHMCMHEYACVCLYMCVMCVHVYVCVYLCMYVYVCVCTTEDTSSTCVCDSVFRWQKLSRAAPGWSWAVQHALDFFSTHSSHVHLFPNPAPAQPQARATSQYPYTLQDSTASSFTLALRITAHPRFSSYHTFPSQHPP